MGCETQQTGRCLAVAWRVAVAMGQSRNTGLYGAATSLYTHLCGTNIAYSQLHMLLPGGGEGHAA